MASYQQKANTHQDWPLENLSNLTRRQKRQTTITEIKYTEDMQ